MIINEIILNEKLSSILYHSTGIDRLLNILKTNTFMLTPDIGSESEVSFRKKPKYIYYMSFSRSKTGKYNKAYPGSVLLVIDGDKLNKNYTGSAVDYWSGFDEYSRRSEMEDRLYNQRPIIDNASSYIKEIHVNTTPVWEDEVSNKYTREIRQSKILANKLNIPLFVYKDAKAFLNLNKEKSIPVTELPQPETKTNVPTYSWNTRKSKHFDEIFELLNKNNYEALSSSAKKKLQNISGFYRKDAINSLSADIHNLRTNIIHRPIVDRLIKEMKKRKLYSIGELIDYLVDKFDES